jgi:DNA-binding MarR family transcriptional regulator
MSDAQAKLLTAITRLSAVRECLKVLTREDESATELGRRVLLVTYLVDKSLIGRQQDLARRLNVTPGRASQLLRDIKLKAILARFH